MSTAQRKFFREISTLVDKHVAVKTMDGKTFNGTLIGINPETLSLSLADAKDESESNIHRLVLNGNVITQISTTEQPFGLKSLAERLDKVFPTMVKLYEENGFIWVMDKIKVTEKGVIEGTGPIAERVQQVYALFISEAKA